MDTYPLFELLSDEHHISLTESELEDIIVVVSKVIDSRIVEADLTASHLI